MITIPTRKFGELKMAINEMNNAKSNSSKQKSLDKLFKALNREGEISSINTGELRKWILGAKPFNNPQKDEILDDLKQILRVKVSEIENGRDLKILNVIWIFRRFRGIRTGWAGWASAHPVWWTKKICPPKVGVLSTPLRIY